MTETLQETFNALVAEHPQWALTTPAEQALAQNWPIYVYGQSEHAADIWRAMAERLSVRLYAEMADLLYVKATLNKDIDQTLSDGIIWYQLHGEGTRNQLVGLTFHPGLVRTHVSLCPPALWYKLLGIVYPFTTTYSLMASLYFATYTTEIDDPQLQLMNAEQRRKRRMAQDGIEAGVPLEVAISQEAFDLMPVRWMRSKHLIPFQLYGDHVKVFTTDPTPNNEGLVMLGRSSLKTVIPVFMDEEDEQAFWDNYNLAHQQQEQMEAELVELSHAAPAEASSQDTPQE